MEFSKNERDAALRAVWWSLHTQAYKANTQVLAYNFEEATLEPVITNLFCEKCRHHGSLYLQDVPYAAFKNMRDLQGKYIGPFIYVHQLHNTVNERIGKPIMPYNKAVEIFSEQDITCAGGCQLNLNEIDIPVVSDVLQAEAQKIASSVVHPPDRYSQLPFVLGNRQVVPNGNSITFSKQYR